MSLPHSWCRDRRMPESLDGSVNVTVKTRELTMTAWFSKWSRGGALIAAAGLGLCLAVTAGSMSALAQYPDIDKNDPGVPSASEPAATPAPDAAKSAAVELTEEEKAEREGRKACKAEICGAFHNRKAGNDISCSVLKSYRKEQLDKMLSKAKASWPWGKVRCSADVKLKRDVLTRALSEDKVEAKLDTHQVVCTVERGTEPSAEIKFDFAPKVTFEKGKAVKAQLNWGKLEAPTLVKAAMWPATATDNTVNVLGGMLVEDINDFIGPKCLEVKPDWEGK